MKVYVIYEWPGDETQIYGVVSESKKDEIISQYPKLDYEEFELGHIKPPYNVPPIERKLPDPLPLEDMVLLTPERVEIMREIVAKYDKMPPLDQMKRKV